MMLISIMWCRGWLALAFLVIVSAATAAPTIDRESQVRSVAPHWTSYGDTNYPYASFYMDTLILMGVTWTNIGAAITASNSPVYAALSATNTALLAAIAATNTATTAALGATNTALLAAIAATALNTNWPATIATNGVGSKATFSDTVGPTGWTNKTSVTWLCTLTNVVGLALFYPSGTKDGTLDGGAKAISAFQFAIQPGGWFTNSTIAGSVHAF